MTVDEGAPVHWLLAFLLATIAIPALATGAAADSLEEHCVAFVVDQRSDGELVLSEPVCFNTEEQADTWAGAGAAYLIEGTNGSPSLSSTFTLGKHYDGFNGSGSSITIVGSSCTGGYWNTSTWWDNRISSSYNGCTRLIHWDYPNKAGSSESTYGSGTTDNLSYLNNRAESVSYHSS